MTTPSAVVDSAFSQAQTYANQATSKLATFTTALTAAIYAPPSLSITWNSISPPTLPTLPATPTLPTITFVAPETPTEIDLVDPEIVIDDFTEAAPTSSFPSAPTISYGTAPTIPDVADVAVPDAPTVVMPDAPSYLSLSTPTFAGIDLHEDYLDNLTTIPTLSLVAPTPYSYALGATYASTLLTAIKAKMADRINGGSGLSPAVEQALWDRELARETQLALANEAEISRNSDALGFHLPAGVLAAQLREAQKNTQDKLSSASRDIAIKQADLEQANLKDAITVGMQLESQLIDYSYKLEQLTFEAAKATADNAIQSYNAQVENYKALLDGYQTYATAYKTIIDGQLAKVEAFRALVAAEQAKADTNRTLVDQYKAGIDAVLSQVEVYRTRVSAAQVLIQVEQTKIAAAGEQIKAFVSTINAETAKVEAYKVGVEAEATKVEVYKAKAQAFTAKVTAQAENARLQISRFEGLTRVNALRWDAYRARTEAERARMMALGAQSGSQLDAYRAAATALEAEAGMHTKIWETQIKDYEAGQNVMVQTAKINNDALMQTNSARLDAAKAGAQVYAQLASSAYSMVHASAGISAGSAMSIQWSYSNETDSAGPTTSTL